MPAIPLKRYELRVCTVKAVTKLLDSGLFHSEKDALSHIINKKPELTGFSIDIHRAYNQYRNFKCKIMKK